MRGAGEECGVRFRRSVKKLTRKIRNLKSQSPVKSFVYGCIEGTDKEVFGELSAGAKFDK